MTDPKVYPAELTGTDVRLAFVALADELDRLEARATKYRTRRTAHARNSLRDVEWQITRHREALRTFQSLFMRVSADLDAELSR